MASTPSIFAQISGGIVQNLIQLTDTSAANQANFSKNFQAFVNVTSVSPSPQIGWLWDGINFTPSNATPKVNAAPLPLLTTASRDLAGPAQGLLIFNTTAKRYEVCLDGATWVGLATVP